MAKPEQAFRLGSVEAAIFVNQGKEGGSFPTIRLQRRYKDEDGNWKSSDSFTATQAASAIAVLQRAIAHTLDRNYTGDGE